MTLPVGMQTAAEQPVALWVGLVEIVFPTHTMRLCDGAGTIVWGARTFTGSDPVYGAIRSLEPITDGVGDEAPSTTLAMLPPTTTTAADLAAASVQGSVVSFWLGIVDPATGALVSDPDLRFIGEVDVPTLKVGQGQRTVEYSIISYEDRTFDDDEGARLNDAFHQSIWPGEEGFVFVPYVGDQMPWGADAPRPVNVTTVSGGRTGQVSQFGTFPG